MNFQTKVIIQPEVKITASAVSLKINDTTYVIQELNFKSLFVVALSGYISISAMRLLSKEGISLHLENMNGETIYEAFPKYPERDPLIRIKQYQAFSQRREEIAQELIKKKQMNYNKLLQNYGYKPIEEARESVFARRYFKTFKELITRFGYTWEDRKGKYKTINKSATNEVNCVINFYSGLIEHRILAECKNYGLDIQIAMLHEPTKRKISLAYDLIEPLRADIEAAVLKLAETKKIRKNDFMITDNYLLLKERSIPKYLKAIKPVETKIPSIIESFISAL